MTTDEGNAKCRGVGFLSLLGLLFIALKLVGCIEWEWWVVLAPIWVQGIIFLIAFIALIICELAKG